MRASSSYACQTLNWSTELLTLLLLFDSIPNAFLGLQPRYSKRNNTGVRMDM